MNDSILRQVIVPALALVLIAASLTFGGAWMLYAMVETLNRIR